MGRITGFETAQELPPKVLMTYGAVQDLVGEGRDINDISVANITERAGIGKGTIYDYFDSREEIIACAFLFYIREAADRITKAVEGYDSLNDVIRALFEVLDKNDRKKSCFVRFVHAATDNSRYSPIIREKLQNSETGKTLPGQLFGGVIRRGIESGELRADLPVEYVLYTIFCKVLMYMMCVSTQECFEIDMPRMREMVISGLLQEIGEKS